MAPEERSEIVQILENSRQEFNAAASGFAESQAKISPEEGRWSVLQCVEHVVVVEDVFFGRLQGAERMPAPRVDKQKEAELVARVPNRTTRAQAPEHVRPSDRFATLAEAIEQFNASRARTIRFAQERGDDLYSMASEHPRFGPINGIELLVIMAGHARRHAEQIREVRSTLEKS